jgi:hypothetical protein
MIDGAIFLRKAPFKWWRLDHSNCAKNSLHKHRIGIQHNDNPINYLTFYYMDLLNDKFTTHI